MEIRRVEGVLPIEAISRDLPLKLENFSYQDMRRLLAQITGGEPKGDKAQEFENLLIKALFIDYTEEGRARIKVGEQVLTARLEVEQEFKPGQTLLLRVKSFYPELKLSLVLVENQKVKELIRELLTSRPKSDYFQAVLLIRETLAEEIKKIAAERYPQLLPLFNSGKGVELISLLLLLNPEVRERLKDKLPKELSGERIKELLQTAVGVYILRSLIGASIIPIAGEDFEGRVLIGEDGGISVAIIEGESSVGKLLAAVKSLGRSISVEFAGSEAILERIEVEEVKKLLEEERLIPVAVEKVDAKKIEELKRKLVKGSFVEFLA
jgi:hypothetical protein